VGKGFLERSGENQEGHRGLVRGLRTDNGS